MNITFLTPPEYGPAFGGLSLSGDWRLNVLAEYRAGQVFTWTGGGSIPGLSQNVQWKDYYMVGIRLAKNINVGNFARTQVFMDVDNIFNLKYLYRYAGFTEGARDWENYMQSLHLAEEAFADLDKPPYLYIPGSDRPGEYRKAGVDFQPVEVVNELPAGGPEAKRHTAWYYNMTNETYHRWEDGSWVAVDQSAVDRVVEDKAYINMPNETSFTFLNPRMVFFGIRSPPMLTPGSISGWPMPTPGK